MCRAMVHRRELDRSLVKAIAWARDLRQRLERDGKSLDELAREDGCSRPYVSSMIRLAYLAPGITQSILDGTQPAQLTLADLMQRDIPVDWAEQHTRFRLSLDHHGPFDRRIAGANASAFGEMPARCCIMLRKCRNSGQRENTENAPTAPKLSAPIDARTNA